MDKYVKLIIRYEGVVRAEDAESGTHYWPVTAHPQRSERQTESAKSAPSQVGKE